MRFASNVIEDEFRRLHPKAVVAALTLDRWLRTVGFPGVSITCVHRTRERNKEIYMGTARIILSKVDQEATLSETESSYLEQIHSRFDGNIEAWAASRFSWHCVDAAWDMSTRLFTHRQIMDAMQWLRRYMQEDSDGHRAEVLYHDVGLGKHIHFAVCDHEWRRRQSIPPPPAAS